jgi:hypothetical protein
MNIKGFLYKNNVEPIVIVHGVERCVKVVYIKATALSLTTSGSTGEVAWRMCQLVSLVVMQTGLGSHLGIDSL